MKRSVIRADKGKAVPVQAANVCWARLQISATGCSCYDRAPYLRLSPSSEHTERDLLIIPLAPAF